MRDYAQVDEQDQGRGGHAGTMSDVERRIHSGVLAVGQVAHGEPDGETAETRGRLSTQKPGTPSALRPLASR